MDEAKEPAGADESEWGQLRPGARELAEAMPRAILAEGRAASIASDWWARAERERAAGRPAWPRYPVVRAVQEGLFEARRAGALVRGLEGAEEALDAQEKGLAKAGAATRPRTASRRLSRLFVVSADGAERFYRHVERLRERHAARLEVVLMDCDDAALGEAAFGSGQRARALLLDHKGAVVNFLLKLDESREVLPLEVPSGTPGSVPPPGDDSDAPDAAPPGEAQAGGSPDPDAEPRGEAQAGGS